MNEEELRCIKALGHKDSNYFQRWQSIRNAYKELLDGGAYRSKVKYNTHNYSTHCVNIYKNIDKLIDWSSEQKPSSEEFFYLDVAVILHDLCMATMPEKRLTHSKEAFNIIKAKVDKPDDNIINTFLHPSEAEFVAEIILGHSDFEIDGKKQDTIKILIDKYRTRPDSNYETNRVCHLAALLRLADEIDVTRDRISRRLTDMNFDMDDENDKESWKHYRKLMLIKEIIQDKNENNRLLLILNDDVFGVESGYDEDLVAGVKNKIESELQITNQVFSAFAQRLCPYIKFETVYIKSEDNPTREKELNAYAVECKKKIKKDIS